MSMAGIAGVETVFSPLVPARTNRSAAPAILTGNGEWTYEVRLLGDRSLRARTSGARMAQSRKTMRGTSTSARRALLEYSLRHRGELIRAIANAYPEVHSMVHAEEHGEEFYYATVQKGTAAENWFFIKIKTDGTVVMKITAPREAGLKLQRVASDGGRSGSGRFHLHRQWVR